MLEESEPRPQTGFDPSMNRHRPASEKTQDISHLLASIFKDLYTTEIIGKDTVAILTKTRRGSNNYHDKYVEDLQQVHSEYSRRMRDADMLENHIIQARVQATATESRAHTKVVEEVGEAYQQLGLPPVRWTFMWCVDNGLLKRNNLICPEDYITGLTPPLKAPRAMSPPGFAKPTVSYNRHICDLPQDDGYTVIPPPERTAQSLLEESETSLTLTCSSDTCTPHSRPNQKWCRVRKPKWMDELSAKSRAEERAGLQKLQQRHKFLRNPRFLPPNARQGGKSLILLGEKGARGRKEQEEKSSPAEPIPVFLANPPAVFFTDYRVGQVYETTVELRNMTATSRHVRVIPPTTHHFSLGLGRFPGEGGMVAPGMSCQYTVRFAPDSLADYQDFLVVETQAQYPLLVPIEARRPPPILTLPSVLDCGYCLVGGVRFVEFLCRNEGLSAGTFCILPRRQWPASNIRSVTTSFAEEPPFGVSPSLFELQPGQATVVEVVFFPTLAERCSQVFIIVCDNCQVKDITIQGEGQLIGLELVYVSGEEEVPALGELCDVTAEHYVRFPPANPHSVQQKTLTIRNNTHLELAFHWQIMQPNLQPLLPGENPDPAHIQYHLANDDVFHVSPASGLLAPRQDHEFLLTYQPQQVMDYHSVCHLVVRDVPELDTAPKVNDVIVMEIEVKGLTEAYQVLLEPYSVHIPGEVFIGTTIRRRFKMWNNSRSSITFHWERSSDCHIMEVEPPAGEIEVNECFDLELVLTGGRPGAVMSSLLCHVQHHPQPVALAIQVTFKGPQVSVSVPSLDLGLMRLGDQTQVTVALTNSTQLEALWDLGPGESERADSNHTQITVEPCRGVLPPLGSCSVDILFRPLSCQHFATVLELAVENGQGCHLSVQADVHSPQVCLLTCDLVFSELYVGVPALGIITLINLTLLPAHYTWTMLQGQQAPLCSASFTPSSGTLGPNAKMDVTVTFTAHTDMELSEVSALCEVTGMKDPLVLGFFSKAQRLNVSYCLPRDCPGLDEEDPAASLVLDFGDNVLLKRPITKQLVITNHTAIPAPFTLEAEYFTGHAPSPPAGQSQQRGLHVRKPLHSVQAEKVEVKAQEGFVNGLLAHGKGAAFFVQPDCGILGAFETQTIDITSFTNMWGEYRDQLICKVGDLQPKLIPMQMTVRGCPLYFQMIGPHPDRQNQGPIIRFGTHVSGGDTVSRSLRLNNTSPYDIRMDWESFNVDQEDRKLLDLVVAYGDAFPLKDADGNEVVGGGAMSNETSPIWDRSQTPSTDGTCSSSLKSKSDLEEEEEEEGALYPVPPQRRLFSVFIRPHEGNASDYPYCITPQQIDVPAGGSSTIHISFTPLTLSGLTSKAACVSFALGFMSLDSKVSSCIPGKVQRAQGRDLEPLRLDLQASVRSAVLSVQMEEEEECLEFCAVASDLIQGDPHNEMVQRKCSITRTFQLKNSTEMPLSFRLSTQPPFSILQPGGCAGTADCASHSLPPGENQLLVLQPRHNKQVKVAFHSSLSMLAYLRQPPEEVPPSVSLVTNESGERKLRFRQTLSVQYSNNSLQTVPLCAHLSLPTVSLSCDSLDFGTCYVGQTRVREVHLSNRGGSSSYWRVLIDSGEEEEGAGVFRVIPDCGVLKHLEYPVSSGTQPLQISFTASEREFQATAVVKGVLGESPLSIQVQGSGSFDERFVSLLADI
ncbi:deleted in lung and esophageal cancer protein 1 isoform X2 [Coregonus clupeaformis]|uniref:deleted in lung and esophageal cancer protein 1 isoform X2 n=1 Tax=Coregonus clupeaformis TaxID=59861 RepID=UPI001E1C89EE|nr:deleted in lung and esophageal cancer protein 1 isoform X2 [Coregonus clupeaformis]